MATVARSMASKLSRPAFSSSHQVVPRRTMSSGGHDDVHRVNWYQAPLSPMTWKEHQIVIGVIFGWGAFGYSAYKFFTRKK